MRFHGWNLDDRLSRWSAAACLLGCVRSASAQTSFGLVSITLRGRVYVPLPRAADRRRPECAGVSPPSPQRWRVVGRVTRELLRRSQRLGIEASRFGGMYLGAPRFAPFLRDFSVLLRECSKILSFGSLAFAAIESVIGHGRVAIHYARPIHGRRQSVPRSRFSMTRNVVADSGF